MEAPFQTGNIARYIPRLRDILSFGYMYMRIIDCCDIPDKMDERPNYVSDVMFLMPDDNGLFSDHHISYDVPCWMLEAADEEFKAEAHSIAVMNQLYDAVAAGLEEKK